MALFNLGLALAALPGLALAVAGGTVFAWYQPELRAALPAPVRDGLYDAGWQ